MCAVGRKEGGELSVFRDQRWSTILAVIGVCGLFCLLIWFLMPKSAGTEAKNTPPDPFQDPKAGGAHIRKLAEKYGTDFDRLSNDDRVFLNAIAMGHGRELLAKTARELKQQTPPVSNP
jgi:hypothetical protein